MRDLLKTTILLLILYCAGCKAPHNNPLDANNPHRELGELEGKIWTLSLPHKPVPEVKIEFAGSQQMCRSNEDGRFLFHNVVRSDGWLFIEKKGFFKDSLYIRWGGRRNWYADIYLNAIPEADTITFYSSVVNRYPNIQLFELFARVRIDDPDNDVDSVFFECKSLGFSTLLVFDTIEKIYERMHLKQSELKVSSAEELIGKQFNIVVKDKYGHRVKVRSAQIQRIIRDEMELVSPASHEVVSSTPTLRWKPVNPGYFLTYTVEVRTDEADPQLVWQKSGLQADKSSITIDQPLPIQPINNYIWAVWIVDRFGNRARSKFKSFQVQ